MSSIPQPPKKEPQMQIPQFIIEMLSAKGRGYVEAAAKIAEGHKLIEEGTLEIAALDGRTAKAGGTDVTAVVQALATPAPKARAKTKTKTKTKTEAARPHVPGTHVKDVKMFYPSVKNIIRSANGWATQLMIQRATSLSWEPCKRVLDAMRKDGLIKVVNKRNNPSHTHPRVYNNEYPYWELASGA